MPKKDDNSPANEAIPGGDVVPPAIAAELRKYYQSLLSEKLPDNLSALARQLADKLANDKKKG